MIKPLEKNPGLDGSAGSEQQQQQQQRGNKEFVEITKDTPLWALSRFLEWNAAAIVTERSDEEDRDSGMKAVAVVTKVDLLVWLVRRGRHHGSENGGSK